MNNFLYPEYIFFSLLCIPALTIYLKRIKKLKIIITNDDGAKKYFNKIKFRAVLFSFSWSFLCVALSCPIYGNVLVPIQKKGASIFFVMDISNSMTIKDKDVSRLNKAKYLADFIIKKHDGSAFGLVLAKGEGILSVPLTFEHNTIMEHISKLSPNLMTSSGTNLEQGVLKATNSFNEKRGNFNVIIVFSDGDETKGNLLKAVSFVSKEDIMLILVGVGTSEGGNIEILKENGKKDIKHSVLNSKLLKEASIKAGNGSIYVDSNSFLEIKKMFNVLNDYNKNNEKFFFKKEKKIRSFEFSICSLILFCVGVIMCYESKVV